MANGWLERERDAWVATNAIVTGDVDIGPESSIWYGVSVRGDESPIKIGARTNIQDNSVAHTDPDQPLEIGDDCTIGHGALLHGRKIGNRCLIGMGAILLQGSEIGDECLIGAGTVVPEEMKVPPRSVVRGVPGEVVRQVTDEEVASFLKASSGYVDWAVKTCGKLFTRAV